MTLKYIEKNDDQIKNTINKKKENPNFTIEMKLNYTEKHICDYITHTIKLHFK